MCRVRNANTCLNKDIVSVLMSYGRGEGKSMINRKGLEIWRGGWG